MEAIRRYREAHAAKIVQELVEFVRIPNNVTHVDQIRENARALQEMMERRWIKTELWETASGKPLVFGELLTPGAQATLLLYGHYDGVPAEAATWHSPPYEPVLRTQLPVGPDGDWSTIPLAGPFADSWRLFGRSVADSKNAIVAILSALDAIAAAGLSPGVNLKFLFDGEEELESPSLPETLARYRDRLQADLVISASGERHQSGRPTVEFGIRGLLMLDLTVYTATTTLHSGHFSNFAPSAAFRLAELLTTMKDREGRVTIPGFHDEVVPLTEAELEAIRAIPVIEAGIRQQFGINKPDGAGAPLQELINRPSFNVRGLQSGFVGEEARNIIPHQATAAIDVRLVKGMSVEETLLTITRHIEAQGWSVLDHEPTAAELRDNERVLRLTVRGGFPATRTPLDSPAARLVLPALTRAVTEPLVVMVSEGGSLPMHLFGLPFVGLPTSNFDCNQHTDDENLALGYLFQAVDLFGSLFLGV